MKNKIPSISDTQELVDAIKYEIDVMRARIEDDDCCFNDDELVSALNIIVRAYFRNYSSLAAMNLSDADCTFIILVVDAYYDGELTVEDCMNKFIEIIKEYTGE